MRKSIINKKYIKRTPQDSIKKINTKNLFLTDKKNYIPSKIKYLSISSKEDIIFKKKQFLKNELKLFKTINLMDFKCPTYNFIKNEKYLLAKPSKFKNHFNTIKQSNKITNYKKYSKFKTNKYKKTIIIDNEGNNNLNINYKYFTQNNSQKLMYTKINNNKYSINTIIKTSKTKKSANIRNDIINNLFTYNNKKHDSINNISENNSLFINSSIFNDKQKYNNNKDNKDFIDYEKEKEKKERINEYNRKIGLLKINIDDMKNKVNVDENNNQQINNHICNYISFLQNIPKNQNINNNIKNEIYSNNELLTFLGSSIQDDFYQSFLYKKSLEKDINLYKDSFNFSQSISEFDNIKNVTKKYEFEKFIHLLKNIKDNDKENIDNNICKNKILFQPNEKNSINNNNVICTIF